MTKVSAIVMASGFSTRMGRNKLFLTYRDKTFLQRAMELIESVDVFERILVISPENAKGLKFSKEFKIILNQESTVGQNMSVRLGTKVAEGDGFLFLPVDQPLLDKHTLNMLLEAATTDNIVFPIDESNQPSSPVYFGKRFQSELIKVTGEGGGRSIRNAHVAAWQPVFIQNKQVLMDIDTLAEYKKLCLMESYSLIK